MSLALEVIDAARYCLIRAGDARVGVPWMWRRMSRIRAAYCAAARIDVADDGEFLCVRVNDRPYAWPRSAPRHNLLSITCELDVPDHPHQYLWGPTRVAPGDVVVDVGACEGAFSAMVAERGARPIVVEPSRTMQRVIRRLFELRGLPEPTIVGAALSDHRGSGSAFFVDDGSDVQSGRLESAEEIDVPASVAAGPSPGYTVSVRTIDEVVEELALTRVDFIKCDAEGADVRILSGARRTLQRFRPKLAFCAYHNPGDFDEMRALLRPLGYRMRGKGLRQMAGRLAVVLLHAW